MRGASPRIPCVAGAFYPGDADSARREATACFDFAREYLHRRPGDDGGARAVARRVGVVPHAGWIYSGRVAATTLEALGAGGEPRTVVLLGAVHRARVRGPALFGPGAWLTPLGEVAIDEELSSAITGIPVDPVAHDGEHSIEVQVPLVQVRFPRSRIVPIAVTPDSSAIDVGERVAEAVGGRADVAVVASSDLTHYGPGYAFTPRGIGDDAHGWSKANDAELLDAVLRRDALSVLRHADENQSACGAGAVAAAVVVAKRLGLGSGAVLAHTTSHEVRPRGKPVDFVGYASVVF